MPQITGLDVDISFDSVNITVSKITLSITDNSKTAMSRGVADGPLRGSVEASGSLELDSYNFGLLSEEAKRAGSWRGMKTFDTMFYADAAAKLKIESFGNKLKISDLLDIDANSEEGLIHKLDFDVTGRDFIKINGAPYLMNSETEHLPSS